MEPMTTNDIIGLVLVYALIVLALVLSVVVEKRFPNIDSRKVVHIGVGNFVFVWWMFTQAWVMLAFFAIPFALILFIAMFRGNVISESRLGELSRKGHNTGLFLYAVTIAILVSFFFRDGFIAQIFSQAPGTEHWLAASIAIMAMTYGDGFGSVVGRICEIILFPVMGASLGDKRSAPFWIALGLDLAIALVTFMWVKKHAGGRN